MPASTTINQNSDVDYGAARAVCLIEGKYPGPKSYCTDIELKYGPEAGTATVVIPLKDLDSIVPSIAGVESSPTEKMKYNDNATVQAQLQPIKNGQNNPSDPSLTVFNGCVLSINPNMKTDTAIVVLKDFRHRMEGCSLVGTWWSNVFAQNDPSVDDIAYRQGHKAHLNPNNVPNCIWAYAFDDAGGAIELPVFCTPFFGLLSNEVVQSGSSQQIVNSTVPEPGAHSHTQACYWTPATFWMYVRWATGQAAYTLANGNGKFPEYSTLTDWITFPPGLEGVIEDDTPQSRKAFERVYHCHKLNAILTDLCSSAGPFAIDLHHEDNGSSTLKIVRTRFLGDGGGNSAASGITLYRAIGGNAADDMGDITVVDAHLTVSGENTYDTISPVGDHPLIEVRGWNPLDDGTYGDEEAENRDTEGNFITGNVHLVNGFSADDRQAAEDEINAYLNNRQRDPTDYLPIVFGKHDVCASVALEPGFDILKGTTQTGYPNAYVGKAPIQHLLSSLSTINADDFARANNRYPISVEVNSSEADSVAGDGNQQDDPIFDSRAWEVVEGVQPIISGDGTISFRAHRDQELKQGKLSGMFYSINVYYNEAADEGQKYQCGLWFNRVRLTVAFPADHRLTTPVSISGETVTLGDVDTDDQKRINLDNGTRTLCIDTGALNTIEERSTVYEPYPIPQSYTDSANKPYPPAGGESAESIALYGDATVIRDDTNYSYDQANRKLREFGRLDRSGEITMDSIDLIAQPGDMINMIQNSDGTKFDIKAVRKSVYHCFKMEPRQYTKCQLA